MTVHIGPDHKPVLIPKSHLFKHTEYFRKALQASLEQGKPDVIYLPDVGFDEFETFASWLYVGKITAPGICPRDTSNLIRTCVLGEVFGIARLHNDALDGICRNIVTVDESTEDQIGFTDVWHVYKKTQSCPPLRSLLADIFVKHVMYLALDPGLDTYPPEFLVDIISVLSEDNRLLTKEVDFVEDAVKYHQVIIT